MTRPGSPLLSVRSLPPLHRAFLTRLQIWLALGAIEFLIASLWIDTDRMAATGLLRLALKKLPDAILFGLVAVGLAMLLGGTSAWQKIQQEIDRRRIETVFPWGWLCLHLACMGGVAFAVWQGVSTDTSLMTADSAQTMTLLCIISAVAASATWLWGLFPVPLWKTALLAGSGGLLAAIPVTIMAWAVSRGVRDSWRAQAEPTMNAVLALLRLFGVSPQHDPTSFSVTLEQFTVEIEASCSGYQGFGVMAVFSSVYIWAVRQQLRFPQAWLLVPLALVGSWCGNVARIASLLAIGAYISPDVALGGFHSQAGWLFLVFVSVMLVGVARRLPWFCQERRQALRLQESAVAACIVPFLAWNFLGLISMVVAADPSFDPWYPLRCLVLLIPLWYWRAIYARMLSIRRESFWGLLVGAAAFALWMGFELMIPEDETARQAVAQLFAAAEPQRMIWLISRIVGSCLAAPIIEELVFRGYLMRRLQAFRFDEVPFAQTSLLGIAVSSLAFGALHGERWLAGILVGLMYAAAVRQTGRLSTGVLAHATTNALLTLYVLTTGDYSRWH